MAVAQAEHGDVDDKVAFFQEFVLDASAFVAKEESERKLIGGFSVVKALVGLLDTDELGNWGNLGDQGVDVLVVVPGDEGDELDGSFVDFPVRVLPDAGFAGIRTGIGTERKRGITGVAC